MKGEVKWYEGMFRTKARKKMGEWTQKKSDLWLIMFSSIYLIGTGGLP